MSAGAPCSYVLDGVEVTAGSTLYRHRDGKLHDYRVVELHPKHVSIRSGSATWGVAYEDLARKGYRATPGWALLVTKYLAWSACRGAALVAGVCVAVVVLALLGKLFWTCALWAWGLA